MFDAEMSPEELFNRFFGGGGGAFDPFGMLRRFSCMKRKLTIAT